MDWIIACRTYKRSKIFLEQTYRTLQENNLTDKLFIFVADQEEYDIYKRELGDKTYKGLIVAKKGGTAARNFMIKYFPEGTFIFMIDDDNEFFFQFDDKNHMKRSYNLKEICEDGFKTIQENNLSFWTFNALTNGYFAKNLPFKQTRPINIFGGGYGVINDHSFVVDERVVEEDTVLTLHCMRKDKQCLVYRKVGLKTKMLTLEGGLQIDRGVTQDERRQHWTTAHKIIEELYPDISTYFELRTEVDPLLKENRYIWRLKSLPKLKKILK